MSFDLRVADTNPTPTNLGALTGILGLQNQTAQNIVNGIQGLSQTADRIGQTQRSAKVNELLGSGALDNLSESEAQKLITNTAGGTINKDTQSAVDKLFNIKRDISDKNFTSSERLAGQKFNAKENALTRANQMKINQNNINSRMNESELDRVFRANEASKSRQHDFALASIKQQKGKNIHKIENGVKFFSDGTSAPLSKKEIEVQNMYKKKYGENGSKFKPNDITKLGAEFIRGIDGNASRKITDDIEEYISDTQDWLLDRELPEKDKRVIAQVVTDYLKTPEGQTEYGLNKTEAVYNKVAEILDQYETEDYFEWKNMLPFGNSPFMKKLVKKK